MSQIKYVHVLEYVESGKRLIGPGKGDRSGTHVSVPDDGTDWVREEWERVDYWELPDPMPKSEFTDWWAENKDDRVHPIGEVLEAVNAGDGE